jgi:hypothetical protein
MQTANRTLELVYESTHSHFLVLIPNIKTGCLDNTLWRFGVGLHRGHHIYDGLLAGPPD